MKAAIANTFSNLSASRVKRVAKEGSWIVAGQVASVLGTLLLVRVVTQYLSPVQYGQLALVLTVHVLINQLITGGLANGISRYYSIAATEGAFGSYFKASFRLFQYAVLATVILGVSIVTYLLLSNQQYFVLQVSAVVVFSVVNALSSTLSSILNVARKRALVAIHGAAEAWFKIIIILALLYIFRPSILAVIAAYALASTVVALSQFFFLKRLLSQQAVSLTDNHRQDWLKKIWKFTLPFSLWGIFTWGQQASDRWSLEHFSSTTDVGQYVVVFQLGYVPIGILTGLIISYLTPIFYQRYGSGKDKVLTDSVHRLSWIITVLSLVATVLTFGFTYFFHDWLFSFLVAPAFRSVSYFLPWVVLAGGLFAAGQMLSLKLMSELRSSEMIASKIVTAIVGVGLNIFGAYRYGTAGVIGALTIFSLLYFLWMVWLGSRLKKNNFSSSDKDLEYELGQ